MGKADKGHQLTDKKLAALERKIARVYKEAARDLQATVDDYFASFEKRDAEQQKRLEEGKITAQQYKQWRLNQIGRGSRYKALQKKVAQRYTEANEVAVSYTNDATPGIYSLNRNYAAYTIERVSDKADFTLWDEQTVKRLIVEEPDLMPNYPKKRAVKRGIDLAYGKKQITACVTSSIIQGKSIKGIADDLQTRMSTMSRDSAIRTARTAVTGAQNAGRMDSYVTAEKMGIKLKREWVATLDNRTRHAHAMLDGQKAEMGKPFKVDGYEIMYPGDTSAPGYLVYNCRCTLVAALDDVDTSNAERWARGPETGERKLVSDMTYQEWAGWKEKDQKTVANSKQNGTIRLPDIQVGQSVGAKAKNYEVMDLSTGEMFHFVEGTRIQNVEVFAGKGSSVVYRNAYKYADRYGGNVEDWQHVKGTGWLTTEDGDRQAEIHWSQCDGFGKHDFFVKKWLGE